MDAMARAVADMELARCSHCVGRGQLAYDPHLHRVVCQGCGFPYDLRETALLLQEPLEAGGNARPGMLCSEIPGHSKRRCKGVLELHLSLTADAVRCPSCGVAWRFL